MRPLKSRFTLLVVATAVVALGSMARAQDAEADQAKALLNQALQQYKALDFVRAKSTLLKVDRDKLTDAERKQRDDHLAKVDDAIKKQAEAQEAYDSALKALKAGQLQEASGLFEQAAASPFLPAPVRKDAQAQRALVARKIEAAKIAEAATRPKPPPKPAIRPDKDEPKPVKTTTRPAPTAEDLKLKELQAKIDQAKAETALGEAAMTQGDLAAAIRHFENALAACPEYSPARRLLAQAQGLLGRQAAPGDAAISKLEQQRAIRKTETQVRFDAALKRARESLHLAKGPQDFARSAEEVNYAQTLLAVNRSLFGDAEYRAMKTETDKLAEFIEQQRQAWDQKRVGEQEAEIRRRMDDREQEAQRRRGEQINMLKSRAKALRDEQKYVEAVDVLDRIRKLDPNDTWAAEWYHQLSRFVLLLDEREAHRTYMREEQKSLADIRWTAIPWYEELRYPRDWPEITLRRQPFGAEQMAESEANRAVRRALQQVLPKLEFTAIPFGDVIQFLRDVSNLNIHVKWEAMRAANIDQNTPVNVKLSQVSVEKALRTVLDDVGGVNPLAFVVDEGVITVSTKDDLSQQTVTRVYDIRDLIVRVPNFDAPRVDLSRQVGNNAGNNNASGLFGDDDDDDDTDEDTLSRQEMVDNILDLIRSTIAPDSWRGGAAAGTIGSVRELNGQIIVTQTSENHRSLLDLLSQLREARALQINVEARFITVNSGFLNRIGIDLDFYFNLGSTLGGPDFTATPPTWYITDPVTGGQVPNVGPSAWQQQGHSVPGWSKMTPMGLRQSSSDFVLGAMDTAVPTSIGGLTTSAFNFAGTFLDDVQVDFLLTATQAHQSTRTLIAPRVTIFNGQRAYVSVQDQQAYVAELEPLVGENVVAFSPVVDTVSTGTVLDVEGTVSADRRYVTLTLRPQVSTILGFVQYQGQVDANGNPIPGSGSIQLPNISLQQVECTVSVPDGGTLLLGGQKWAGEREREMGVPMVSKVPVLNRLFTNRAMVRDEQTLLILVRPKIIIQREYEEAAFPPS